MSTNVYVWRKTRTDKYELYPDAIPSGIIIHHYVGCGDGWYLTCRSVDIVCEELISRDIEHAKAEALRVINIKAAKEIETMASIQDEVKSIVNNM